jgi:hypothetical protein
VDSNGLGSILICVVQVGMSYWILGIVSRNIEVL